jgi:hypothetical protein
LTQIPEINFQTGKEIYGILRKFKDFFCSWKKGGNPLAWSLATIFMT